MGAVPRYMRHRPTWQALCPDHVAVLEASIIIMHVVTCTCQALCPDHVAVLEASIIIMHVVTCTCQALCPDHVVVLIVGQKKL